MKISKQILIPILLIIALVCIIAGTQIYSSQYPFPNIKSNEIKTIKVFHNNDSKTRTPSNSDGKKLLKLTKQIASKSTTTDDKGFILEECAATMAVKYKDDYCIEIRFKKPVDLKIKDTTVQCDYLVLDVDNSILYYRNPQDYLYKKFDTSNSDFSKIKKYLSSNF